MSRIKQRFLLELLVHKRQQKELKCLLKAPNRRVALMLQGRYNSSNVTSKSTT